MEFTAETVDRGSIGSVSPTIFREGPYRFFFFSREEPRMRVHVASSEGNAKFWLEPKLKLAENHGIPERELSTVAGISNGDAMKSKQRGESISRAEVTHISRDGFWLLLDDRELFVSFAEFPWFREAPVGKIHHVEWPSADHLYWPELDIDLSVRSIEHLEEFPLKFGARNGIGGPTIR